MIIICDISDWKLEGKKMINWVRKKLVIWHTVCMVKPVKEKKQRISLLSLSCIVGTSRVGQQGTAGSTRKEKWRNREEKVWTDMQITWGEDTCSPAPSLVSPAALAHRSHGSPGRDEPANLWRAPRRARRPQRINSTPVSADSQRG